MKLEKIVGRTNNGVGFLIGYVTRNNGEVELRSEDIHLSENPGFVDSSSIFLIWFNLSSLLLQDWYSLRTEFDLSGLGIVKTRKVHSGKLFGRLLREMTLWNAKYEL